MSGTLHLSRDGEHVAVIEIDNPPRNTFGLAMRAQLRAMLAELSADHSVRCVVIAGRGKAFCSGDDLREELAAATAGGERGTNLRDFGQSLEQLESFRAPVIAAIGGWCVGGGVELALCCDIRIASTEAKFVCAGVNVGLAASALRLPRTIGAGNARHMLFTGSPYDGETALRFGLVSELHAPAQLMPAALRLAARIASRAPLAVEAGKRLASGAGRWTAEEAKAQQAAELTTLLGTADHLTAVTAFFEKKTPVFSRR